MDANVFRTDGYDVISFREEAGVLCVVVLPLSNTVAELRIYEAESALFAYANNMSDEEFYQTAVAKSCKNRFGAGVMRRILRTVKEMYPWFSECVFDRRAGTHPGFRHKEV